MGGRRIRCLKMRMGRECCISREGTDQPGSTVEIYKLEESEEEDTVLVGMGFSEADRATPGELPRVLNLKKERSEHLKWTHLDQVRHCTYLTPSLHFQRTLNREG